MKTKVLNVSYQSLSIEELSREDKDLILRAEKQAKKAYAPYSEFYVGAAVLLENGKVFMGCNQENASYPLSLCAERVAIFAAHSQFPGIPVKKIIITAINPRKKICSPISPCGACRQVIRESEFRFKNNIEIILKGETDKVFVFDTIKSLLPLSFDSDAL